MEELFFLSLFPILIISSIWDVFKQKKIPNAFVILGLILGMTYSFLNEGWIGLLLSICSIIIIFIIGFLLLWGIMAAGDVKLLIVISSFIGIVPTLKIFAITLLISSILFVLLKPIRFINSLKMVTNFIFYTVPLRMYEKEQSIAFAPYITVAFICFYFLFL